MQQQQEQQHQLAQQSRSQGVGNGLWGVLGAVGGDNHIKQHKTNKLNKLFANACLHSTYRVSPGQHSATGQQTISSSVPKPHEGTSWPVSMPLLMYLSTCGSHCDDSRQTPGKFGFTVHGSPSASNEYNEYNE